MSSCGLPHECNGTRAITSLQFIFGLECWIPRHELMVNAVFTTNSEVLPAQPQLPGLWQQVLPTHGMHHCSSPRPEAKTVQATLCTGRRSVSC